MNKPLYLSDEDWRNFHTGTRRGDEGSEWPEPDMRLVEDDRTPVPTLGDDALPAGWEEWIARGGVARLPARLRGGRTHCRRVRVGRHLASRRCERDVERTAASLASSDRRALDREDAGVEADHRGVSRHRARCRAGMAGCNRRACQARRGSPSDRGAMACRRA